MAMTVILGQMSSLYSFDGSLILYCLAIFIILLFLLYAVAMSAEDGDAVRDSVKDYYGKRLQKTEDLELKACTVLSEYRMPKSVRQVYSLIHEEVMAR